MATCVDTTLTLSSSSSSSSSSSLSLPAMSNAVHDHFYDVDDSFEEDVCSICLESFTFQDPSTATCCKHEYHLQCILEWSQRRKECPICWQDLILKDPLSQELLVAVASERNSRVQPRSPHPSTIIPNFHEDHDTSHSDDSDFDELIMQHLAAAAASRDQYVCKRGEQSSSGLAGRPDEDQTHNSPEERQYSSSGLVVGESSNSNIPSIGNVKPSLPDDPSAGTTVSISAVNNVKARTPPRKMAVDSPKRSSPTGFSFSESMKLRFSAASSRCKESISKGTRGFKEKLLVRNSSVKELSKGVQREVKEGIAGVAKVLERLDLSAKRSGSSVSDSNSTIRTSIIYSKGKNIQGSDFICNRNDGDAVPDISSGVGSHMSTTIPGCVEVSLAKNGQ